MAIVITLPVRKVNLAVIISNKLSMCLLHLIQCRGFI